MDLKRLEEIAEGLSLAFYVLMFVALAMGLAGSLGTGFVVLVIGSCAHVVQAALVELVDLQRAEPGHLELAAPAAQPRAMGEKRLPRRGGPTARVASLDQARVRASSER